MLDPNYAIINKRKMCFYSSGDHGPVVLLIHGNSCSGRTFRKQMNSTLASRFQMISLDLPGHGDSEPPKDMSQYSLAGFAETVNDFKKALGIVQVVLVGWSLGGHIALQSSSFMEGIRGIFIYGTPPLEIPLQVEGKFLDNRLMDYVFASRLSQKNAESWVSLFFSTATEIDYTPFTVDVLRTDNEARPALGRSIRSARYLDEVKLVSGLRVPLAIVHGADEMLIDSNYLRTLFSPSLWRDSCQVVADAGHAIHWQRPRQFNRLLGEFVEDVTGDSG